VIKHRDDFPRDAVATIAQAFPPTLEDIITPICILFVGSKPPSPDRLKRYAKPLIVRKEKVLSALRWLRDHSRHYRDIFIDASRLDCLEDTEFCDRILSFLDDCISNSIPPAIEVASSIHHPCAVRGIGSEGESSENYAPM
jgi:hypothetical protein